ncbi:hypothetical protein BDN72DRAFT_870059 [Pluteus cervinus]|uniref:Uncharacterized protein n=1 Tax=Pluteus cervinus TaxID=181527 RepID=A0ACD3AZM3_9AGAR|nr:hypothetical protein BDN72DRAFT_870059 [Pluteus cervinus]
MLSRAGAILAVLCSTLFYIQGAQSIGQDTCVLFKSSGSSFPIVSGGKATPILISQDDWPGVQRAASDFVDDIKKVTNEKPKLSNYTVTAIESSTTPESAGNTSVIIVGTLGHSSLIDEVVKNTKLDVSSIKGNWESFLSTKVDNPLPGVDSAYVIIGADKRGTIFALYDHSEQFGVSPWYWWADVPTPHQSQLHVESSGCSHGSPTVQYRGIFLNDEQPALQNWAMEQFTNGTGSAAMGSPFNHLFYNKLFELILRMKGNYLWPAMWGSAFAVDDPQNQFFADYYGVVMGTSHQEPMMRSTPNEFSIFEKGSWDYLNNNATIKKYWRDGVQRAKPFESYYTLGMRGFGDTPLSEETNIALLEQVVEDQTEIFKGVYGEDYDISTIPQLWTLYKEVEGYYDDGMRVPDYVTLLWSDDNWGNVRRFPIESERNRTGGAGVYYHVGDPRDYKWITSTQISKVYEQMSLAVDRNAVRVWIVNVGDLKPYERETEFFINYGWNATRWNPANLDDFVAAWGQREFSLSDSEAQSVTEIVGNLTRFNSRRKPELLNSTTYSLINYREAENVLAAWDTLEKASTAIYNKLPSGTKPAFFQLVHHPVLASANVGRMLISAGKNNLRASQALLSTNDLADQVEEYFETDYDLEVQYHKLLNDLGYYYWQQPLANTMPPITRVQPKKQALSGVMRIVPEGTPGAWPGDNPNQCAQGYDCPPPSITLDSFSTFPNRYIDVGAGGPASFTFTVKSSSSWLQLSPEQGSVSAKSPEQRVFVSVKDWSQLAAGQNNAVLTFTAKASGQADLSVTVNVVANKNTLPAGFKGFVEGDGAISIEAAHTTRRTNASGVSWTELPSYGRTQSAVTPWPRLGNGGNNFTAGAGPALEYDFYNFNTISGSGNVTVTTYLAPSLNANDVDRPLAYAVQIDSLSPQTSRFIPASAPGSLPAAWGGPDGFVANSVVSVVTRFGGLKPGAHTLKLHMIEPAVVVQKIIINTGGLKPSYLGPPESLQV